MAMSCCCRCVFFFFQAEDGIRDYKVTGVQTCALPILTFNTLVFENELAEAEQHLRSIIAAGVDAAIVQDVGICRLIRQLSPDFPIHVRSEERRVGKECRSRWSPYH